MFLKAQMQVNKCLPVDRWQQWQDKWKSFFCKNEKLAAVFVEMSVDLWTLEELLKLLSNAANVVSELERQPKINS